MDCKIINKFFLILAIFAPTQLNAVDFKGKFLQGHYIIGVTDPSAKIIIDNYVEKIPEAVATSISVQNVGASDYNFTVKGVQANDPTLTLERGKTYEFDVSVQGHPFWIKTDQINGSSSQYNEGITNNGLSSGKLTFTVPVDAPSTLYYISYGLISKHSSFTIIIVVRINTTIIITVVIVHL